MSVKKAQAAATKPVAKPKAAETKAAEAEVKQEKAETKTDEPEVKQETAENKTDTGNKVGVTVIQRYSDLQLKRVVEAGETFTVDETRAAQLKGLMLVK